MSDLLDITIHDETIYPPEQGNPDLFTDMRLTGDAVRVYGYMAEKPFGHIFTHEEIRAMFAPVGKSMASIHFYKKVSGELKKANLVMNSQPHMYDVHGFVYWLKRLDNNDVKIGLSKQPHVRKHQVAIAIGADVELIQCWEVSSMYRAEIALHSYFSFAELGKEWFFDLHEEPYLGRVPKIIEKYLVRGTT